VSTDDPPDSPDGASPPDQAPLRSRPAVSVFGSVADVWVPTLLVIAVVGFFAALAHAPVVALAAVGVFVLGLIPQAKMKRADLLMELQERFSVMAGDKEALDGSVRVFGERRRKSAYAFYLRFWNLQLLEFGLWRYGMLPSDTFAHWIVRRLLSFRPGNPERYWDLAPLDGWHLVREEFVGTDFRQFIEAAILIGKEVDRTYPGSGAMDAMGRRTEVSIAHYDSLHRRIERLLVRVGGGELGSTFIIRWFNARRPSIRVRSPERLAQETTKRLLRERPWWRFFSPLLFALLVPIAILLGLELRESWPDIRDRTSRAVSWLLGFGGEDPDPAPPPRDRRARP
jgi:hypothetical protein